LTFGCSIKNGLKKIIQQGRIVMNNQVSNNVVSRPSDSSDTIAMMLEIIFGFFGILGMGWLYAGNVPIAAVLFVGFLIVAFVEMAIATATLGIAACLIVPFNLAVAVISGLRARDHVRNTGAHGSIAYVIVGIVVGAVVICGGFTLLFGGLAALGSISPQ
jgi:ABC-type multidrug transport system fused ATPase/permease subunit